MSLKETAELLGVKEGTLRQWRFRGQGPKSFKVGVAVAYRLKDIEDWKKARREGPAA